MNSQWHCKILPIYLSVGIPWIKGSRLLVTECLRIGTAVDRRIFNLQHVSTVKKNNRRREIVFKKNTPHTWFVGRCVTVFPTDTDMPTNENPV